MNVHVPGGAGGSAGMLLLGTGSGRLGVGGGQVFMLEILHYLLGQFRQHRFGQGLFCCLWGPGGEEKERGGGGGLMSSRREIHYPRAVRAGGRGGLQG